MAKKCEHCGKNIGLLNPGLSLSYDEYICNKCWAALGFTVADKEQFGGRSYLFIKNGKAACLEAMAEAKKRTESYREKWFNVVGVRYKNDAGNDIQKIIKSVMADRTEDEYEGYKNKELIEEFDEGDRIYQYEITQLDAEIEETTFDGAPALKVHVLDPDRIHIGWIAKDEIGKVSSLLAKHKCSIDVQLSGGPFKVIEWDDDEEKYSVKKDKSEYYAKVCLSYFV